MIWAWREVHKVLFKPSKNGRRPKPNPEAYCWRKKKTHSQRNFEKINIEKSHQGVVVITTAQSQSTKAERRFSAGSNPACGVSEIGDGEDLWQ